MLSYHNTCVSADYNILWYASSCFQNHIKLYALTIFRKRLFNFMNLYCLFWFLSLFGYISIKVPNISHMEILIIKPLLVDFHNGSLQKINYKYKCLCAESIFEEDGNEVHFDIRELYCHTWNIIDYRDWANNQFPHSLSITCFYKFRKSYQQPSSIAFSAAFHSSTSPGNS